MAFETTRWSLILAAKDTQTERSRLALEELCKIYWPPLYAYLRSKGNAEEQALDLTQAFFTHLLEKDFLGYVDPDKGKFRTFLLVSLNRFLASEQERNVALKRNKGRIPISIDVMQAEKWYGIEPRDHMTPEKIFERNWALTLMQAGLDDLKRHYVKNGNIRKFELLSPYLTVNASHLPYSKVAEKMGTSEGAVKVAIFRLRKRYGDALREQVKQTLSNPDDLEDELQHLLRIFGD